MPVIPLEPRLSRVRPDKKPEWADVTDRFYANSFDAGSGAALLDSAEAWATMDADEQSFHAAHLAFRQLQALGDLHTSLKSIERGLTALDPKAIRALKHLPAVRKALVVIAHGQRDMLDLLESNAGTGLDGDNDERGDDDEPDDDDQDGDDGDDDSDLADAIDDDESEDENHGPGDIETVVPDAILPAGTRRPAPAEGGDR